MWAFSKTSSSDFSSIWVCFLAVITAPVFLVRIESRGAVVGPLAMKGVCASLFAFESPFKTFDRSFVTNAEPQASEAIL